MNAVLKPLEILLRPMVATDIDVLMPIELSAYPHPWTPGNFRDCLESGYECWVAEQGGAVVGYWIMMQVVDEGHVLNCCVAPAWQGRGLGRHMMEHLIAVALAQQTEYLFLEVRPSNTLAIRLYESLEFESIALRRGYYPTHQGREDALVMRRCL